MRKRNRFAAPILAVLAGLALSSTTRAQDKSRSNSDPYAKLSLDTRTGGPAPQHDLSGAWMGPANGKEGEIPPMTPAGEKMFRLNKPVSKFAAASNDPIRTCDPLGMPRNLIFQTRGIEFAQMPDKVVILHQYQAAWRQIWTDGRELPKNVDQRGGPDSRFYGFSTGHWDGDNTFVVDTVGTEDRSWLDNAGHPHSVNAHIQERYTRIDHNHLELTVTVDDPKIYTRPFTQGIVKFVWAPDQQTQEQICVPSETPAGLKANARRLSAAGQKSQGAAEK